MMFESKTQFTTFQIDKEIFAIEIYKIQEIIRYPEITKVPVSIPYLKGLANLRGNILPIIDTRIRLGLPDLEVTEKTRVLVLNLDESLIGLIVDEVKGVLNIENVNIEVPSEILSSEIDVHYIRNVIYSTQKEEIILELNIEAVCDIQTSNQASTNQKNIDRFQEEKSSKALQVPEKQLVSFFVAQEEYAFVIKVVREVLRVSKITEVPEAPEFVLGVITLRGELLVVIDIRKLFHIPSLIESKIYELEKIKQGYEKWFLHLKANWQEINLDVNSVDSVPITSWIENFRTSSEALANILQKLRFLHQDIKLHIQEIYKSKKDLLDIEKEFNQLFSFLEECKNLIYKEISEDQRILVIEVQSKTIGILVDRMNQVIRVPENLIELASKIQSYIQGIVKLEKGKRLILLLDELKLFSENFRDYTNVVESKQQEKLGEENLSQEEVQLVIFKLGKEEFGIFIEDVREINRLGEIAKVPNTPEFVEGIMNLRGNVIPVIDFRKRFGMESVVRGESTRLVIVEIEDKIVGFIVDFVLEVVRIPKNFIENTPPILQSKVETKFISGIGNLHNQNRFIIILDINKILTEEEKGQLNQT
jgi:chemotaxis signal transduction protein